MALNKIKLFFFESNNNKIYLTSQNIVFIINKKICQLITLTVFTNLIDWLKGKC